MEFPDSAPNILVSVIIPVKNGENFVRTCFSSILNQTTLENLEVSIYDDGSTDSTVELIRSFAPIFGGKGIKFVFSCGDESMGVGYAKNHAILQSTGQFLCFLDVDDEMMPDRVELQLAAALEAQQQGLDAFLGSQFTRDPVGSTVRYTNWACKITKDELANQIYTSFGPTVIAPTWFISRVLFDRVQGFNQQHKSGYPEDLEFFYKALPICRFAVARIDKPLVIYRWHPGCATFQVHEKTIFDLRLQQLENNVLSLPSWQQFTIWSGKQGRRLYRALRPENQQKVVAFCDVAKKRIDHCYEFYDEVKRQVTAKIPIIDQKLAQPPVVVCVKLDMTGGQLEDYLVQKGWRENVDYVHFGIRLMTTQEIDVFFHTALELVKKGGQLVRTAFEQPISAVLTKSSSTDLVTETDQAVEKLLIDGLSAAFPDHKFIGEESAAAGQKYKLTDSPTWIIDPIDGTTNFVHRIPLVGICVGLTINKEPVIGIVFNPITHEIFSAIKGRGAYKNGFPIHVSSTEDMSMSVIVSQLGSIRTPEMVNSFVDSFKAFMVDRQGHGHRAFGSAAINMVYCAQGSIDAYIEYGLHSWDIAAAVVILREAGGALMDPSGGPFDLMSRSVLCAGTEKLAREISGLFTHTKFEREGDEI